MSWLGWTHFRPSAYPDRTPRQADILPLRAEQLPPVHWRILINDQVVGTAEQRIERHPDGHGSLRSRVELNDISVDQIVHQGVGQLLSLMSPSANDVANYGRLTLTIDNTVRFDQFGRLNAIECRVAEKSLGDCVQLHGTTLDYKLRLRAYLLIASGTGSGTHEPIHEMSLPLPEERMLVDSLSPRTRFSNLSQGQTWTFDTYNPLMPTRPLQVVEATVAGRQAITLARKNWFAFHVTYERADATGLSLSRHIGDVWVTEEGDVLKQTASLGPMSLTFERQFHEEEAASDSD